MYAWAACDLSTRGWSMSSLTRILGFGRIRFLQQSPYSLPLEDLIRLSTVMSRPPVYMLRVLRPSCRTPLLPLPLRAAPRHVRPLATSPPPAGPAPRSGPQVSFFLLLSLIGATTGGYLLNSILNPPLPPPTLLPSSRLKELQEQHQPKYGSKADYLAAINELNTLYGKRGKGDRISMDEGDLTVHGISDWSYHEEGRPTAVVWVESTDEVREVVRVASRYRVPITPFSGGTSLEGHFSSVSIASFTPASRRSGSMLTLQPYGGISLDLSMMDQVLRVSEADGDITVQAGLKWEDLNAYLAEQKIPLFFPLDPGPGATIGGMVGTGCSGTNAVRYGTAKAEWFLNLVRIGVECEKRLRCRRWCCRMERSSRLVRELGSRLPDSTRPRSLLAQKGHWES